MANSVNFKGYFIKKQMPEAYFSLSALALLTGFLIYWLCRDSDMLIYRWFDFLPRSSNTMPFSNESFLAGFVRYNLPDGLWLLSGLLFLRAVWHGKPKTLMAYQLCFLCLAFAFEAAQLFDGIPGTFDILDVLTMGSTALLESSVHKVQLIRRQS